MAGVSSWWPDWQQDNRRSTSVSAQVLTLSTLLRRDVCRRLQIHVYDDMGQVSCIQMYISITELHVVRTLQSNIDHVCVHIMGEFSSTLPGLYSLSGKASYHKISWSLKAERLGFRLFQSLWNFIETATLTKYLPNIRAIRWLYHPHPRRQDFMSFGGKTSCRSVNRSPYVNDIIA